MKPAQTSGPWNDGVGAAHPSGEGARVPGGVKVAWGPHHSRCPCVCVPCRGLLLRPCLEQSAFQATDPAHGTV